MPYLSLSLLVSKRKVLENHYRKGPWVEHVSVFAPRKVFHALMKFHSNDGQVKRLYTTYVVCNMTDIKYHEGKWEGGGHSACRQAKTKSLPYTF